MKNKKSKNTVLEMIMIVYGAIGLIGLLIVCIIFVVKGKYNVADTSEVSVTEADNNGFVAGDTVLGSGDSDDETAADVTATTEDDSIETVDETADSDDADTVDTGEDNENDELINDAEAVLDDDLSLSDDEDDEEETEEAEEVVYTFKVKEDLDRRLNVRSLPAADSEKIGTLAQGTEGVIDEEGDEWSLIEADGLVGYVKNEYINIYDEDGNLVSTENSDETTTDSDSQENN